MSRDPQDLQFEAGARAWFLVLALIGIVVVLVVPFAFTAGKMFAGCKP